MATISIASVSIPGGSHLKSHELWSTKCNSLGNTSRLTYKRKSNQLQTNHNLSVRAEYNDRRGGGGDFVAGFLVGSALFGTLAYIFAPQDRLSKKQIGTDRRVGDLYVAESLHLPLSTAPVIRRSLLNEDEYGFRRARRPIYYDEGLEKTRQTLNAKISQLNSAIDNVSSRLRGGNNMPAVPIASDPEEATM
ncbi:uncharacterized protein LOC114284470 isoform X1 [Camellia sinensis]|uniref:uncharacterized protein LOC114284470 isoform X1 n=1 Tax=Camellia sinensis TaxID=4442 RepID=UPI001036388B|nr:uncharacterized protein LOC114284470 isoform X1 [Camellia sinensis]